MPLSDPQIRNAKPKDKAYRLFDSKGLYIEVAPSGGKWWRFKYRFAGKEKRLSLGVYPEVPLRGHKNKKTGEWIVKGARDKCDEARSLLSAGIDPAIERKANKAKALASAATTFEAIARQWHARGAKHGFKKDGKAWTTDYAERVLARLERDVFPAIGSRPIAEIRTLEISTMAKRIAARSLETGHRALRDCASVFRYAIAHEIAENDPTSALMSKDGHGILPSVPTNHFATITDPAEVGALMRAIASYDGYAVVKAALQVAPMLFVRPGELRAAEWKEVDLDAGEWRIPAERMKMRTPHIVPLSSQAVEILRGVKTISGECRYVFPGARTFSRPMSENAINAALRSLGYEREKMTAHGFRAMASTLLNEQGWNRDAIERQLAHAERDGVRAAYNYAEHLPERRRMMQHWADYLGGLASGAQVVSFKTKKLD